MHLASQGTVVVRVQVPIVSVKPAAGHAHVNAKDLVSPVAVQKIHNNNPGSLNVFFLLSEKKGTVPVNMTMVENSCQEKKGAR